MKALWIGFVWPEPSSSAAGYRALGIIEAFQAKGWEVRACSPCQPNEHRERLERSGVSTARFAPNDPGFDAYVREYGPDLVVFDRFMMEEQFGWRVRAQCPDAIRVLDTSDLHALRRARQRRVEQAPEGAFSSRAPGTDELEASELLSEDAIREVSAIFRSDLSLVVSDAEQRLLLERYGVPPELIEVSRFFYPDATRPVPHHARRGFVVIGNFRHSPNLDSFRLLQRGLWARIRASLPEAERGAELHVYGAYPTQELMALDDARSGFRVKGWAKDAHETLSRYLVNLAPLRFGAGIKGKVSDGWRAGTPCAATSIAAEGMHGGLPFGGAVEDEWERFAQAAAGLYVERARWEQAQAAGFRILRELYGRDANSAALIARIERLLGEREAARARNFTGLMLWHHSHRSTEYFSRWIEAKNRLKSSASGSS